ncbi:hypothetical protein CB1_056579064 [Camelus ferus]|nr:hypothetical protein CB1_056579064 [Camelus ferus]
MCDMAGSTPSKFFIRRLILHDRGFDLFVKTPVDIKTTAQQSQHLGSSPCSDTEAKEQIPILKFQNTSVRMKSVGFLFCCWKAICFNSCKLINITITVEKGECGFCTRSINTTWCAGYCYTW